MIYADIHGTSGRKNLVQPYTVDLLINGATTRMELDTGASVSLISEGTYDEWGSEAPPIQPANTVLRSYAGSLIPTLGKLNLQVGLPGSPSTKVLPALLVKGNGPDLLGRDWLSSLRLDWREVHRLAQEEEDILAKFPQVCSEKLGEFTGSPARIVIDSDVKPKFCKVRTVPYNLRELVDDELKRLEAEEVLSPVSYSEWAAPIVPVLKSDKKSVRICGDFKQTCNRAAKRDSYPLPRVEDILAQLGKGKFFSKLDLSRAYNQIPLDEQSKPFTTITTQRGLYQFNRLPFGISAAPAIFQRLLEDVLRGLPNVVNYLDDILIAGATRAEHNDTLSAVLERLQRAGLTLKRSKCDFFKSSVVFLGHEISQEGIRPIREKVAAVLDAPSPTTVEELRSFSGAVNFYVKFLPNLSGVMAPLYELLQKGVSWHWGKEQQSAFQKVKEALASTYLLVPYDNRRPLLLAVDASPYGLGAVLAHRFADGSERPIAFASRSLNKAERNYSQLDKEGAALVFGVKKFRNYLLGRHFEIFTDHKPLLGLFDEARAVPALASSRLQRWALLLEAYAYTMRFRPGKENANADMLSRLPLKETEPERPPPAELVLLLDTLEASPVDARRVRKWTSREPVLAKVMRYVQDGWPRTVEEELKGYVGHRDELSSQDGILLWGNRVVIPAKGQQQVLDILHESHPGISKMKALARSVVWWPGINQDIERRVNGCRSCQESAAAKAPAPLCPWEFPARPWSRLHLDYAGPFLGKFFLIIVDAYSKWMDVYPVKGPTAESTIDCLEQSFCINGLPDTFVSDNGPAFVAEEFRSFAARRGIVLVNSAPYHPASNGQAERSVQSFKAAMKKATEGSITTKLRRFLFQYRITPHTTTGVSPAELLHGRKPKSLLDLVRPDLEQRVQRKQWSQKEGHDRKSKFREFMKDEEVYVKNFRRGPSWVPAVVMERSGPNSYVCELDSGRKIRAHVDHVRRRAAAWTPPSTMHLPVSGRSEEPKTTTSGPTVASPEPRLEEESTETSAAPETAIAEGQPDFAGTEESFPVEPQTSASTLSTDGGSSPQKQVPASIPKPSEGTGLRRSARQRKPKIPYDV